MSTTLQTATAGEDAHGAVEIDPSWVTLQSEGFIWKHWSIRLPAGATLADLNESPTLFRLVQLSRQAICRLDRMTIFAYDESWLVDAVVSGATAKSVTLAGIRKIDLPARQEVLFQDATYKVAWFGRGYAVQRKSDGLRVSEIVTTTEECERELRRRYSRPAA